ncbi:DUF1353 domain-containing protein [Thalassobaculum litoreum]|uniref:DUF1353 domain-containing protein n=1 Tax=Thalassobaculum litoreum DSM 18839 TaxID=1123362 RepID=A0A8G2EYX6_9PROT|nr:DUF1353 domain-containing protein [Thalassobaculum litoreum]SDF84045.1 Protein of unknown function [Thalassobaculum litoreum DSM 18839]
MERFPDELVLRKLNGSEWEVQARFRYWSARLLWWIEVPAGFTTDLASIPWFGRWYVSVDGDHTKAAVVHDYLYTRASAATFPSLTRREADRVFREALRLRGVGPIKTWIMYAAVRIGGGRMYRDE